MGWKKDSQSHNFQMSIVSTHYSKLSYITLSQISIMMWTVTDKRAYVLSD